MATIIKIKRYRRRKPKKSEGAVDKIEPDFLECSPSTSEYAGYHCVTPPMLSTLCSEGGGVGVAGLPVPNMSTSGANDSQHNLLPGLMSSDCRPPLAHHNHNGGALVNHQLLLPYALQAGGAGHNLGLGSQELSTPTPLLPPELVVCCACDRPIYDRYLSYVLDKTWHATCLVCADCKAPLETKCYAREGMILCKDHFLKRFGTRCAGCARLIDRDDLVRRARDKVFHVDCFKCGTCDKRLDTGEQLYILDGARFICKRDYFASRVGAGAAEFGVSTSDAGSDLDEAGNESNMRPNGTMHNGSPADRLVKSEASLPSILSGLGVMSPNGSAHGQLSTTVTGNGGANMASGLLAPLALGQPLSPNSEKGGTSCKDLDGLDNSVGGDKDLASPNPDENSGSSNVGGGSSSCGAGAKRRGPRTTIKAKQLETLKAAFAATPKPTRHIREQLANETGLNMRVIQVWFQNRRSKERRMKQLRFGAFRPGRRSRSGRGDDGFPPHMFPGTDAYFTTGPPGPPLGAYWPAEAAAMFPPPGAEGGPPPGWLGPPHGALGVPCAPGGNPLGDGVNLMGVNMSQSGLMHGMDGDHHVHSNDDLNSTGEGTGHYLLDTSVAGSDVLDDRDNSANGNACQAPNHGAGASDDPFDTGGMPPVCQ